MASLLAQTQALCRLYNIQPARSKGQNFLINEAVYDEIIRAVNFDEQTILEVGPGLGFLSARLAKKAKKLVAVELDDRLAQFLQTAGWAKQLTNLQIVNQDILKFNPQDYFQPKIGYQVVANLPYNISSIFLRTFLSHVFPPTSLLLMLQQEVVERILATPPKMNLLAFSVQYYAQAKMLRQVQAADFWPQPQVDSALIKITYQADRLIDGLVGPEKIATDRQVFCLAKIGFSAKRKMLKNNLAAGLKMDTALIQQALLDIGHSINCRAENLSVNDWQKLTKIIFKT